MNRCNHFLIGVILVIICVHFDALAQDSIKTKPENPHGLMVIHKTNPFAILWGPIPLTAEYRYVREMVIAGNQSLLVGVSYLGKSPVFTMFENQGGNNNSQNTPKIRVSGLRFQMGMRWYTGNIYAPKGFYVGPLVSYSTAKFTTDYYNTYNIYIKATHFNINMLMGVQGVVSNRFTVDLFCGLGYKKNSWEEHYSATKIRNINLKDAPFFYNGPVKFTLGLNVGLGF